MSLVTGFLPGDRWPEAARARGLRHRRALALVRLDADEPFGAAAHALLDAFAADLVEGASPHAGVTLRSLLADADTPETVRIGASDAPVALVVAVNWHAVGGPAPYHDSLTVEAYTRHPPLREALVRRVAEAAFALGVHVGEIREGALAPPRHRPWPFG